MALTDRFSDYHGDDVPDLKALATRVSLIILRVLGSAVVGLICAAIVGFLALVLATPFVENSTLDTVFSVTTMISWPIMALVLWFTLFRSGQDL